MENAGPNTIAELRYSYYLPLPLPDFTGKLIWGESGLKCEEYVYLLA